MTEETITVREAIEQYDNVDNHTPWSERGNESERHTPVVTPRAFNSEIGYGVNVERIPEFLATTMMDRMVDERVMTLSQFLTPGEKTREEISDLMEMDGYSGMVHIYRIDGEGMDENPLTRFGNGGYLIKYVGGVPNEHRDPDAHSRVGWYAATPEEMQDLVGVLLGREEWTTVFVNPSGMFLSVELKEMAKESLLEEESYVEETKWLPEQDTDSGGEGRGEPA